MNVIYKYPLVIKDTQFVTMQYTSEILSVQMQNGQPVLWAMVETEDDDMIKREIIIKGTGHDIPDMELNRMRYITTIQDGRLVWHVFEGTRQ